MKVLMISGDTGVFNEFSEVRARVTDYASLFDELHIVAVGKKKAVKSEKISESNLFLYSVSGGLLLRFFRCLRMLMQICRRANIGVISAQGADEFGFLGFFVARRFGIPFQLQIHTDIMSPWYRRASWRERLRYYLAFFLIPRADCIRVVSQRVRKSLVSKFKIQDSRMSVLPIFTDLSHFLKAKSQQKADARFADYDFKIIAAGRFVDKEKNFGVLIEVMRDLVKARPRVLLVLVGEGPDRKHYELQIARLGIEKNVALEPWRDDLSSYYKIFDLFVLPSYYEGWGRSAVEALAAGLPVLMTDVGLAGEVIVGGNNGIIVPVGDYKALRDSLFSFFEDAALRKRLQEGVKSFQKNCLKETKERYLEEYRKSFECCLNR